MPIIKIEMMPQPYEKKAEIARVFTEELHRITGIPKEPIVITFADLTPEHVASGGQMLADRFKKEQDK